MLQLLCRSIVRAKQRKRACEHDEWRRQ